MLGTHLWADAICVAILLSTLHADGLVLQTRNTSVCRVAGKCLDYSTNRTPVNVSIEGASLHLELNYAGKYTGSARDLGKQNICIKGRLAPSFFLIGAQKSATTNFASRFTRVALNIVPPKPRDADPNYFWKELHVFDEKERYTQLGLDGWLDYYPRCGNQIYSVGMDATPSYLSSTQAPVIMRQWYSDLSNKITFLVLLRQPVYRMHSGFYQARKHGGCDANPNLCRTFAQYVSAALGNARRGCLSGRAYSDNETLKACENQDGVWIGEPGDPFYLSLYVPQLKHWLSQFSPEQFVVAPMLTYVAPHPIMPSLVKFIAQRIGSNLQASGWTTAIPKGETRSGNSGSYPPLDVDLQGLSPADSRDFGRVMEEQAGPAALARLLSPRMKQGLTLFAYDGQNDDLDAINTYIQGSW